MDSITKALIMILVIDLSLFLVQTAVTKVSAEVGGTPVLFFNVNKSILEKADTSPGAYVVNSEGIENRLYTSNPTTSTGTSGNWFTDTVKDVSGWFINNVPGLNYLVAVVAAPGNMLAVIGAPIEVSFGIGALWFMMTVFLIVMLITGRNQ